MSNKALLAILILITLTSPGYAEPSHLTKANSLIGQGETWGDNRGPFIRRIGGKQGQPWCAYFVSYCLGVNIPNARGFLKYKHVLKPVPGDLAIWTRGSDGKSGHIGIVKAVYSGHFDVLEGNTGKFPSKVRVVRHKWHEKALIAFVRVK